MDTTPSLKFHEYAELFPLMTGSDYNALLDDIRDNGQHELIVLFEGKILDGRNRYRACHDLDFEPRTISFEGDRKAALDFALSKNLHRRQLTVAQRALIAASMSALRKQQANDQGEGQGSVLDVQSAAKLLGVSERSVSSACKVVRDGAPALQEAVNLGKVSISAAELVAKLDQDEQQMLCAKGPSAVRKTAKEMRESERKKSGKSQQKKSASNTDQDDDLDGHDDRDIGLVEMLSLPSQSAAIACPSASSRHDQSPAMRLFEMAIEGGDDEMDLDQAADEILGMASEEDLVKLSWAVEVALRIRQKLETEMAMD